MDIQSIILEHNTNGGCSYRVSRDVPERVQKGYIVSVHKGREQVIEDSMIYSGLLKEYIAQNRDVLSQSGSVLGTWVYENRSYIDCSVVCDTLDEALELARMHAQIAVYSLQEGKEVLA